MDKQLDDLESHFDRMKNPPWFIPRMTLLDQDAIVRLRKIYSTIPSSCRHTIFEPGDSSEPANSPRQRSFFVDVVCPDCKSNQLTKLSKTVLHNYLLKGRVGSWMDCVTCSAAKKAESQVREKHQVSDRAEYTTKFIDIYCNPGLVWNSEIKKSQWFVLLSQTIVWTDQDAVAKHIQQMPYAEFLKTPYWKAVAYKTKALAKFRCSLCNSAGPLATHHRTYEIRGREHASLKDLFVLCSDCHEKFHEKI